MSDIASEINKRRTFAIISHPDAGKTTLTEKFLLYGGAINLAGSVKGKATARHAVSDWMEIEKERGISVTSSVLQFNYGGYCINILDTPGHVDFSAETERTMQVIDYAVLVISGTDGIQSHSATLWKLLRQYNIPVFIFVNKMDLCGADKKKVLSELQKRFSNACIDFSSNEEDITESLAMCFQIKLFICR